jgi:transcriptional regulator with XRE-family HTH domain
MENRVYNRGMGRPISKPRPKQGARLAAFRQEAGLSQTELADALGVTQSSVAYWETAAKPPRSDVLSKMAKVLGVRVEQLLEGSSAPVRLVRRTGPVGKLQRILEEATTLPRSKQELVVQFVTTLLEQHKKAS